jgi:hypothetical protein
MAYCSSSGFLFFRYIRAEVISHGYVPVFASGSSGLSRGPQWRKVPKGFWNISFDRVLQAAMCGVLGPEIGMNIIERGLVRSVSVNMFMTSPEIENSRSDEIIPVP